MRCLGADPGVQRAHVAVLRDHHGLCLVHALQQVARTQIPYTSKAVTFYGSSSPVLLSARKRRSPSRPRPAWRAFDREVVDSVQTWLADRVANTPSSSASAGASPSSATMSKFGRTLTGLRVPTGGYRTRPVVVGAPCRVSPERVNRMASFPSLRLSR